MLKFEYKTENDIKLETESIISNLKEDDKSEFIFDGEELYKLGNGHSFLYGFFISYITKSGIKAKYYYGSDKWFINYDDYKYINNEFIKIPKVEVEYKSLDDTKFPLISNFKAKLISDELASIKPI